MSTRGTIREGTTKILLLPFCLSPEEMERIRPLAGEYGYVIVVARSTARALAEVRRHVSRRDADPVRIVGVVCDGRAKKVWLGLLLLSVRRWGKKALGMRLRRIELARVGIAGGSKALFGRRACRVGRNGIDIGSLARALAGLDTFMRM